MAIDSARYEDVPRAFLACRVPPSAEDDLTRRLSGLRHTLSARAYRWTRRDQWHLTMRFFGALPGARRAALDVAIGEVVGATVPFLARMTHVRALPSWRQPHVIAFVIASDGALESLASRLDAAIGGIVGAPDQPFLPHLSVLRVRRAPTSEIARLRAAFETLDDTDAPAFEIASMALYRSELARTGARHTVLSEYPFAGASQTVPS